MPLTDTLTLDCPAKVNLALSVGSPRTDGMHPIASWMVAVRFADRLTLATAAGDSGGSGRFDTAFYSDAPVPQKVDWPREKDLAYRALELLRRKTGRELAVDVTLRKRIPAGAGLGGGSGNAAGVLVGVNRLLKLGLTESDLTEIGLQLGSDVGFLVAAMLGRPSALVAGLGERIEPLPLPGLLHLVLIFPPFGCPTGPVYRAFDQLHPPPPAGERVNADESCVRALAAKNPLPQDGPFNDLAAAACAVRPELHTAIEKVRETSGLPVHVTGSGSTLFIISPSELTAKAMARKIAAATGLAAAATRTL